MNPLKKIKAHFYALSLRNKISASFIIVNTIFLTISIFVIFQISSQILVKKTVENTLQDIKLVAEKLDLICEQLEGRARAVITEKNVQIALANSNQYEGELKYQEYWAVRNELSKIIEPGGLVQSVLIYDYKQHVYDSGNIQDVQSVDIPTKLMEAGSKQQKYEWKGTHRSNYRFNYYVQNIISYEQKIYNENNGKPLGVAVLNVDEGVISDLYSEINLGTTGSIFMINANGEIASSPDKEKIFTSVKNEQYYNLLKEETGSSIFRAEDGNALVVYRKYEVLDWTIVGIVPVREITSDNAVLMRSVFFIFGAGILVSAMVILRISKRITGPLAKLGQVMTNVSEGDLEARAEILYRDDVGALALNFNNMLEQIDGLMYHLIDEQRVKRKMEFALIQAQINPHFLYNTLESICGLAQMKYTEEIIELVNELATFYRGILSKGSSIVTIEEEIQITESYLKIMRTRFQEKFNYSIQIEPEIMSYGAIKLILQPLVENSIQHGFKQRRTGGMIEIIGRHSQGEILLEIRDNGCGISKDRIEQIFAEAKEDYELKSFGLKSVEDRIHLYFGEAYNIIVESVQGDGTLIKISLPVNELCGGKSE